MLKLIFIYGAPGTGKLTVSKELVKITGYTLFHNHLTVDLAHSLFPFGTKEYSDFVQKIRLDIFEAVARSNMKGMIFTFVYGVETWGGRTDDAFVRKVMRVIQKNNGEILFVKLLCSDAELYKRVKHPSRKAYAKLHQVNVLKSLMKKYKLQETIPFGRQLIIDNTHLSAKKVAAQIKRQYQL